MNDPQYSSVVPEISKRLQRIQLAQDGWMVADGLLQNPDVQVQFYGALTFQIKLNRDAKALTPEDATGLLARLLSKLVEVSERPNARLVLDKLSATLATYFIQSPVPWSKSVRHLICTLSAKRAVTTDSLNTFPATAQLMQSLSPSSLLAALRLCKILAEDVSNMESPGLQHQHLEEHLRSEMQDICDIILHVLDSSDQSRQDLAAEAVFMFDTWAQYASSKQTSSAQPLQQVIPVLAQKGLLAEDEDLREAAVETFVTMLEHQSNLLSSPYRKMLTTLIEERLGPECAEAIQSDQVETITVSCAKLITAQMKSCISDLVEQASTGFGRDLMTLMRQMIDAPGWAGDDNEITILATEFWNDYAEHIVDEVAVSEQESLPWLGDASSTLVNVAEAFIPRICLPTSSVTDDWDKEIQERWAMFCDDVYDYMQRVATVPETHLFELLCNVAEHAVRTPDWSTLVAVLSCLNVMADEIVFDENNEAALVRVMSTQIFTTILDSSMQVGPKTKLSVVRFVDSYARFVQNHDQFVPLILSFLLNILEQTTAKQVKLADVSAKTLATLCSACRKTLTGHVEELIQMCPKALSGPASNAYQKEKVMTALASVIEAMPQEQAKTGPLLSLIALIEGDLNEAVNQINIGQVEQGESLGTTALQCLAGIGKAFQDQADVAIDLESDAEDGAIASPDTKTFWDTEPAQAIQRRILSCFDIVSHLRNQGDAIDAACAVLRTGLAETMPGPFVFPASVTVSFLEGMTLQSPRIETMLTTACSFVSAHSRHQAQRIPALVMKVYQPVARIMMDLSEPTADPELAQLCIDFLERLTLRYADVLLGLPQDALSSVFRFVLECMAGQYPMLKRASAAFITSLVDLTGPKSSLSSGEIRTLAANINNELAPHVAVSLMSQIGGNAQRSDLDSICKALRAFVFTQPSAKRLLEEAMNGSQFPSTGVSASDKRTFSQKLAMLRGGKQTNAVVKEFWALCKGTVSSYE